MTARRVRVLALATLLAMLVASRPARAVATRTWTETVGQLQLGRAEGIAVTSQGRLEWAPLADRLGEAGPAGGAAHVWAVVRDARGNLFLGTGPDGRVVEITPSGSVRVFAVVAEPMVTALLVLPDGALLAGTAPDGKIYRIAPGGQAEIWCETNERYVWSLALGADRAIYAGTGDDGRVLKIGPSGRAEPFFESGEAHVMALAALPSGGLVAGGAGRGLLYRVDPKGGATVLHDGDMAEVSQVVVEKDGGIVATLLASPEPEPRPPAVRIHVPSGASVGSTSERVSDLDERPSAMLEGVIEGLSPESAPSRGGRRPRGRVVRVAPGGAVTEIWRSSSEAPLALAVDASGRPVFGTGEPARIYRVEEGGEVALLATLPEGQASRLLLDGERIVAATSNPAAAYRLEPGSGGHVFVSRPFDAQSIARWGTIRWRAEGPAAHVEFQARSGNSAEPDATWSDWGPVVTDPSEGHLGVPDGRFLEWRARFAGPADEAARVGEITVSFAASNHRPVLDGFRIDGSESALSGPIKLRWNASDPDSDPVSVRIEFRSPGSATYRTALVVDPPDTPSDSAESEDPWKDGKATWETAEVAEGPYEVRAVASDQRANAPGEGRDFVSEPNIVVTIDRSPPRIEVRSDRSVEVADTLSPVRRLEVVEGNRTLFTLLPIDGVADSKLESFRIPAAAGGEARKLRAVDAAGNTAETEVPP